MSSWFNYILLTIYWMCSLRDRVNQVNKYFLPNIRFPKYFPWMVFDETIDELYFSTIREVGRIFIYPGGGGFNINNTVQQHHIETPPRGLRPFIAILADHLLVPSKTRALVISKYRRWISSVMLKVFLSNKSL